MGNEIDNHEHRINLVCSNGQKLIDEGHEDASQFTDLIHDLNQRWQQLQQSVEHRREMLLQSEKAQQVFFFLFFYFYVIKLLSTNIIMLRHLTTIEVLSVG